MQKFEFTEAQAVFSIICVALIFFMMMVIIIIVMVRNFRQQIRIEKERIQLMNEIQNMERERISDNLHDELGPQLSAVKLLISQLKSINEPDKMHEALNHAEVSMKDSTNLIRSIIRDIKTITFDSGGLKYALTDLSDFIEKSSGIKIHHQFANFH